MKRELAPIYGIRAFPIDYPNPVDSREGRGGYGIWFHGTNKVLKPKDSNGCIVLGNHNIDELARYIRLHDTPAIISDSIELVSATTVSREAGALEVVVENWRRAWETKDIDAYMSFYSPRFKVKGKDWKAWKDYKIRLAQKYSDLRVEIDNLRLLRSDGVVVATFRQRYRTNSFRSEGVKKLYFQQNSKQWKIIGEYFIGKDETLLASKKIDNSPRTETIKQFVYSWVRAWEHKDLNRYIASYHPKFISRGMNLKSWKKHRVKLNKKYRRLKIDLKNLDISKVSSHRAGVTFLQIYRADAYKDVGIKKLILVKKGEHWKIKREEWRPLKR